jgi:hypothetical protein
MKNPHPNDGDFIYLKFDYPTRYRIVPISAKTNAAVNPKLIPSNRNTTQAKHRKAMFDLERFMVNLLSCMLYSLGISIRIIPRPVCEN